MILFVGQVGSDMVDREAFQEIDYRRMFGSVAKWAAQIDRAERIPEYVAHAYPRRDVGTAGAGGAGAARGHAADDARRCADAPRVDRALPAAPIAARDRRRCAAARRRATRRSCSSAAAAGTRSVRGAARVRRGARAAGRLRVPPPGPVRQPPSRTTPATSASASIPKLAARVRDADVLLVIGERLGEMTTGGYTLLDVAGAAAALDPRASGADELGRVYQPAGGDCRDARRLSRRDERAPRSRGRAWRELRSDSRTRDYAPWRAPRPGARRARHVADRALARRSGCPTTRSSTNGAGNYTAWLHRLFRYRRLSHPARALLRRDGLRRARRPIAAKAVHPDRMVISWNGDGCFLMNGQELATAVQYGLAVIFVVVDNGDVRHDPDAPGAPLSGARLRHRPRQSGFRGAGARATARTARPSCAPTSSRRRSSARCAPAGPRCCIVKIDPQALTMGATLDALRAQALKLPTPSVRIRASSSSQAGWSHQFVCHIDAARRYDPSAGPSPDRFAHCRHVPDALPLALRMCFRRLAAVYLPQTSRFPAGRWSKTMQNERPAGNPCERTSSSPSWPNIAASTDTNHWRRPVHRVPKRHVDAVSVARGSPRRAAPAQMAEALAGCRCRHGVNVEDVIVDHDDPSALGWRQYRVTYPAAREPGRSRGHRGRSRIRV